MGNHERTAKHRGRLVVAPEERHLTRILLGGLPDKRYSGNKAVDTFALDVLFHAHYVGHRAHSRAFCEAHLPGDLLDALQLLFFRQTTVSTPIFFRLVQLPDDDSTDPVALRLEKSLSRRTHDRGLVTYSIEFGSVDQSAGQRARTVVGKPRGDRRNVTLSEENAFERQVAGVEGVRVDINDPRKTRALALIWVDVQYGPANSLLPGVKVKGMLNTTCNEAEQHPEEGVGNSAWVFQ